MSHTLLLADDSVAIQRVVELTFAGEDVRVVAVGDGQQAIERLATERPDIVLADIAMPLADGYAVAEFVRSTPAIRDVPVLLLAGAFDIVEESRLGASGARGVLVKPFEPHVVISRVKELLGLVPATEPSSVTETARLVTAPEPPRPVRTLSGDAPFWQNARPRESAEPSAAPPETPPQGEPSMQPVPEPAASTELVAAREARAEAPSTTAATLNAEAISSELVDRIAARVVEQLGDRLRDEVAEVVLNVSERLVREEIQRIRSAAASQRPPEA